MNRKTNPSTRPGAENTGSARTSSGARFGAGVELHLAAPGVAVSHHVAQAVEDFGRLDEIDRKVVEPVQGAAGVRQHAVEGVVAEQDPPLGIGDHHRLLGQADLPAHVVELALRDQHVYGAELQHHIGHGIADQPCRRAVGVRPALAGALDKLVPLGE